MEKKILVAVDHSRQSLSTIDYAATIARTIAPVSFTLLSNSDEAAVSPLLGTFTVVR